MLKDLVAWPKKKLPDVLQRSRVPVLNNAVEITSIVRIGFLQYVPRLDVLLLESQDVSDRVVRPLTSHNR